MWQPLLTRVAVLLVVLFAANVLAAAQTAPARIISTSPSITETLFALGLGDRVVGVSSYCRFPAGVVGLPKVGSYLMPDVELMARLRPDLVFVHAAATGPARRLDSLRIPYSTIEQGTSLARVFSSMRQIASAAGVAARGDQMVADVERRLQMVRGPARTTPRPRVLFIIGRRPGTLTDLVAIGPGGYVNDLIQLAGAVNVLDIGGQPEYPRISMEVVLRLDPDVIVDTVDMGDTDAERARREPINEHLWKAYPTLAAVRAGRVHAATTDALVVPGPRVVEAAQWVAAVLNDPAPR